ncbi:hypothetical protein EDC01DRAFT_410290 [Geopyxis carbonaria]|nr:hypothetical protein EDC01DRAFT_410290 [Geopyxis carbonaria]
MHPSASDIDAVLLLGLLRLLACLVSSCHRRYFFALKIPSGHPDRFELHLVPVECLLDAGVLDKFTIRLFVHSRMPHAGCAESRDVCCRACEEFSGICGTVRSCMIDHSGLVMWVPLFYPAPLFLYTQLTLNRTI